MGLDGETKKREYDLEERFIEFACRIIDVVAALPDTRAESHIAGQLVRCGTSPAPNYAEAQGAESRRDFVHKLRLVLKELRETRVWLRIVRAKGIIRQPKRLEPIETEVNELISIIVTSIGTAAKGLVKPTKKRKAGMNGEG